MVLWDDYYAQAYQQIWEIAYTTLEYVWNLFQEFGDILVFQWATRSIIQAHKSRYSELQQGASFASKVFIPL